ncbi:MAG: NAD(P)/FAD-dependent oxidoreductase [Clostridia bacterium]|nr:NAD(P)/FAD-dependent oxidoreductase [Clostridia bacterium]
MIIDVNNITVPLDTKIEEIIEIAAKQSNVSKNSLTGYKINKKSIDARHKKVQFNYCISLFTDSEKPYEESVIQKGSAKLPSRPIVIGSGPAGLFCAYILAKNGYCPMVFEKGSDVDKRINAVKIFNKYGKLNCSSNIQFGEGGAGTFSDGKLTTRINDRHCDDVLNIFVKFGAPEEILYLAKPHIGTDILCNVVKNIRNEIIRLGGDVFFEHSLEDIKVSGDKISSVCVNGKSIECGILVLATGHSSRDTYRMLYKNSLFMEPKPFAAGVRIEHSQDFINKSQYGDFAGHPLLGAADYRLAYNGKDRSCFSFCMCPGGYVTAAASEENTVVVNGMSNYARNGKNANSALVVSLTKNDFDGLFGGMNFQTKMERAAFDKTHPYYAPVQNTTDFINGKAGKSINNIVPTYPIGYICCNLNKILPNPISKTLCEALRYFDTKIKNFTANSVLTGVETRTSSPLRITRNENMQSVGIKGIYPIGEGAGYAGGIMSSAVDGIKAAEKIIAEYAPF